ncbi:hypothetical protein HZC31_08450 [Candidatus Woesearchaeota archaeon]|nr:hypothetical protein [Candidatus Woesearchaeota archaeon]
MEFKLDGFYDPQKRWWSDNGSLRRKAEKTGDRWKRQDLLNQSSFLARYADGKVHVYLLGHTLTAYALLDATAHAAPWEPAYLSPFSREKKELFIVDLGDLLEREMPFPENLYLSVAPTRPRFGRGYNITLHPCSLDEPLEFSIVQRVVIDGELKERQTHLYAASFAADTKEFRKYVGTPQSF